MDGSKKPQIAPTFCEYASGPCDQNFADSIPCKGLLLYPSDPPVIARTIESAVKSLKTSKDLDSWKTWRDLRTAGQIIFCTICKAVRFSENVFADVTTLNFNVLFEIGFSLGLEKAVAPIRDASFIKDKKAFEELGLLDTMGYTDFQNSDQLATRIQQSLPLNQVAGSLVAINFEAPLYVVKGPLNTEGEVRLLSTLKRSALRFRTYDPAENSRISLYELRKQVSSSLAVIAHLSSRDRKGADIYNARSAFAAGLALAQGKVVLMLQEGHFSQPLDYRDIVKSYTDPEHVQKLVQNVIRKTIQLLQSQHYRSSESPTGLLESVDIGDTAAENESHPLQAYFLRTAQYQQAKLGYARLVVGRKGSGKTAIFYAYKDSFGNSRSRFVLDLKPEGSQFTKLRETILSKLSPGLQEHTLTAFWNVILVGELAQKIAEDEVAWASRDPERSRRFMHVTKVLKDFGLAERGDFSERLLNHVNRITKAYQKIDGETTAKELTQILYVNDIRMLDDAVSDYLSDKDDVALIVDNLDKGWPTRGATAVDILVIKTLLEATRKLQSQLESRNVRFHCLVFLRNDIYEHLVRETSDKGKDTSINLDWSDPELFKELFRLRVVASGLEKGTFDEIWSLFFERFIDTSDSFQYIVERTLMRPRDFLSFLHCAIEVAINRGHDKVLAGDLRYAEVVYSTEMLKMAAAELCDVYPGIGDMWFFLGCSTSLSAEDLRQLLIKARLDPDQLDDAINLLAWYGFLGVRTKTDERPRFAYEMRYEMKRLLAPIANGSGHFVIHAAYRSALECVGSE